MGMLLQYHRQAAQAETKPKRARKPRARRGKAETEQPEGTPLDGSHYADLTDEQVLEAYVTTIPEGEATERDAQVTELRAVNAHRDTFDADPEASDGE